MYVRVPRYSLAAAAAATYLGANYLRIGIQESLPHQSCCSGLQHAIRANEYHHAASGSAAQYVMLMGFGTAGLIGR